jgi:hypothetical protein
MKTTFTVLALVLSAISLSECCVEPAGTPCGMSYVSGRPTGEKKCVNFGGSKVVTSVYCAFLKMSNAAKAQGVNLVVKSGFRVMSEQQYFWNCYQTKRCNNGNLAARPGYSNHQNGIAFDLAVPAATYRWLVNNAQSFGFIRAVSSEDWHWEYHPGKKCNAMVNYACKNGANGTGGSTPDNAPRGTSCSVRGQKSQCIDKAACAGSGGTPYANLCPGAANIQCCWRPLAAARPDKRQ